jgi:hypothetical protein
MLSRRVPHDYTPNEITRLLAEKRRAGVPILDLTETNPTRAGLSVTGATELAALADPRGAFYDPDPRGSAGAREAVARYYMERARASGGGEGTLSPEDLVLVASTSEAYAHLFRLLCEEGDEVVAPRPSYPLFEPLASLEGVRLQTYRLTYDPSGSGWRLDLDSLEAALGPRTRAVVLVQPNNPTGSCLSSEEIARVEDLCATRGIAIISDEVFGDFPWPPRARPLPSILGDRRTLTFVLGGLSKLCGMPQMKLGWIALAGPAEAKREAHRGLEWIADLFLSVSTPVQIALPTLLKARDGFRDRVARRLEANLARLHELGNRNADFAVLEGEGGWSATIATPAVAEEYALAALRDQDVLLHPGHFYDFPHDGHVVVSLLPQTEIFAEAVRRLDKFCGISRGEV